MEGRIIHRRRTSQEDGEYAVGDMKKTACGGGEDIIRIMLLKRIKNEEPQRVKAPRLYDKKPFLEKCKEKVLFACAVLQKFH